MEHSQFIHKINRLTSNGTPYFFTVDYEQKNPGIWTLKQAEDASIFFDFKGFGNIKKKTNLQLKPMRYHAVSRERYYKAFDTVQRHLAYGDTYLLNLTFASEVFLENSLEEIFHLSHAPYKILFKDEWVCFSPESFIRIRDGKIYSYPMKGTIDASLPHAEERILNNAKEKYEHNTIVDLIRNDLSSVATDVELLRYRYIERIRTGRGDILQVSSEIRGTLPRNWRSNIGQLLMYLLPAGSISGAPKQKTCEIIAEAEGESRGYYTGISGIFDGQNLETAVNIRFIRHTNGRTYYHSGGGITALSNPEEEYEELKQKIYIPRI